MRKLWLATLFSPFLSLGAPSAAQTPCGDPDVTVTVTPASAVPGETFFVEVRNDSDAPVFLPSSCIVGPVFQGSGCSGTAVFTPNCAAVITEIPAGETRIGAWDQTDGFGQPFPEGSYSIQVSYFREGDSSLRSCCVDVAIEACAFLAGASPRNGSGVNPTLLSAGTPPVLGSTWTPTVDCSAQASGIAGIFLFSQPANGPVIGMGELLVGGVRYARQLAPHSGGPVAFSLDVPGDVSLCGLQAHAQALCLGGSSGQLTNAFDLILGG